MIRRYGIAALFLAASLVTLQGCGKPKVGAKCTAGQLVCNDAKSGLFCGSDGTFQAMSCLGSAGCQTAGQKSTCDQSVAAANDVCTGPGYACSTDMKTAFQCTGGKFVPAETCKGPGACKIAGGDIACDNDIADLNDPCRDKGDYACTSDKSNALQCDNNKMGLVNTCRGPKGCSILHKGKEVDIDCDMSIVQLNDPCAIPNNEGCSLDKKTMLTCSGGKYSNPVACGGPNGCTVTANQKSFKVTCDQGTPGGTDPGTNNKGGGKKGKRGK